MPAIRVQRIVQQAGLASRRQAEAWIEAGRVTVNGRPIALGASADPVRDTIAVDGVAISRAAHPQTYLALYKPSGYTTSLRDRHAEHLITDLVPAKFGRLFPVGRLDRDSEGLILLTNDGSLAHRLMHPSHGVEKVYEVWVKGFPKKSHLERMRQGIMLEDGQARPDRVDVLRREGGLTVLRVILHEGHKREIRRIFDTIGHPVERLVRIQYGNISVRGLEVGRYRPLTHREVRELTALVT
jgi:23S rRNA pseudouridine2605 synthase